MRRFVEPPSSGGLRVPVRFTPQRGNDLPPDWEGDDGINLDAAEHTLVVVLADARMAQRVTFQGEVGRGAEWKKFLDEGAKRAPVGKSPHHVFGVAIAKPRDANDTVDDACFDLGGPRHMLGVAKEPSSRNLGEPLEAYALRLEPWLSLAADEIAMHITIRAIHLLAKGNVPANVSPEQKAPVQFFLSHAKADLSSTEADPVRKVEDAIKELPIDPWFDAAEIAPGAEFGEVIEGGIARSSIILSFVTDTYSSRPWCKREILAAKNQGVPILVIEALSNGEARNFPYLGNVPTVHWANQDPKVETQRIVSRALRETLRFQHNHALLEQRAAQGDIVLATPPEAVLFAWKRGNTSTDKEIYLYPDPPLTEPELTVLTNLRPGADFVTPFTKMARRGCPPTIKTIALSTSVSNDKERFGLSRSHEEAIFDEVHAYFLVAGIQIAYGGVLQAIPARGTNFTQRLFELVRAYSPLAPAAGRGPLKPILNIAPWPLRLSYGADEMRLFGIVADYIEGTRPPKNEVPGEDDEIFPPGKPVAALDDSPERHLAWARGLTAMRLQMTEQTQAKIVIGGTLSGFKGLYPGVVEEAWLSLRYGKPLYLVGAFGGAARAVIDLLQGRDRPELTTNGLTSSVPFFREVIDLAKTRGLELHGPSQTSGSESPDLAGKLAMPDRIVDDFRVQGKLDLPGALHNGLNAAENEELFRSVDPWRIAELVLEGLSRLK
jgi:hypothetical protein